MLPVACKQYELGELDIAEEVEIWNRIAGLFRSKFCGLTRQIRL